MKSRTKFSHDFVLPNPEFVLNEISPNFEVAANQSALNEQMNTKDKKIDHCVRNQ